MFIKADKKEMLAPVQFYLDRELLIAGAEKIICMDVSVRTTGIEALKGEARATYKAVYKTIYKSAEGIKADEQSFEERATMKSDSITPKSFVDVTSRIIANEYVGTDNLKVRSTVELTGWVIVPVTAEAAECREGLITKKRSVPIERILPVKESEIIASSETEYKERVESILITDTKIGIINVSTATEICEIKGEAYTYVTYLSDGGLFSQCITTPFEAEILAEGITASDRAFLKGLALSTSATLRHEKNGSVISLEIVVGIKGFAIAAEETELLADAYSLTNEIKTNFGTLLAIENICMADIREKIAGSVALDTEAPRARTVLSVSAPTVGTIEVINEGQLAVEGIISAEIVYLDENEEMSKVLAELPYRFVIARDFGCSDNLYADAEVICLTARVRHNDEIEVLGEIAITVYGSSEIAIPYLGSCEAGGEKILDEAALSLYLAGEGEDLFDVAKELNTTEDVLMTLNPDLELPLKGGEKILLYRSL